MSMRRKAALPAAVVMFLVENVLHFTVGNAMLEGRVHPGVLLRMPMLVATLLGLIVALTDFQVWPPLASAIDLLGQVAIPLMLVALGVRMTGVDFSEWRMGLTGALLCPLAGLAIALPYAWIAGLNGQAFDQLLLFAALPPAVLNFLIAERFNQEPRRVAAVVLMGNAASLMVIPLLLSVLYRA